MCYKHWMVAAIPKGLSEAFKEAYERDAESFEADAENADANSWWSIENKTIATVAGEHGESKAEINVDAGLKAKVYDDVLKAMAAEREREFRVEGTVALVIPPSHAWRSVAQWEDLVAELQAAAVVDQAARRLLSISCSLSTTRAACADSSTTWRCVCLSGMLAPSKPELLQKTLVLVGTQVVKAVEEQLGKLNLQLATALISYKDDQPPVVSPFFKSQNIDSFVSAVGAMQADCKGGGDIAEDVDGAFDAAASADWTGKAKFIVFITDAPGHGELNDNASVYDRPERMGQPNTFRQSLQRLAAKDVSIIFACLAPRATAHMDATFRQVYKPKDASSVFTYSKLDVVPADVPVQSFHFIFCLDESGSMSVNWENVVKSTLVLIQSRESDQAMSSDRYSIISFDEGANLRFANKTGYDAVKLVLAGLRMSGGGTCFAPALRTACQAQAQAAHLPPVFIFMSDGANGDTAETRAAMSPICSMRGAKMTTIMFGGGDGPMLREMSGMLGENGKYEEAARCVRSRSECTRNARSRVTSLCTAFRTSRTSSPRLARTSRRSQSRLARRWPRKSVLRSPPSSCSISCEHARVVGFGVVKRADDSRVRKKSLSTCARCLRASAGNEQDCTIFRSLAKCAG
jgi:Mg-chelatase subunit ChlD